MISAQLIVILRTQFPNGFQARGAVWTERPFPSGQFCLAALFALGVTAGASHAGCVTVEDSAFYEQRKEQAIVLMQYGDTVVRATGGKIRCNEDAGQSRQVCSIDGSGEMLFDTGNARFVVQLEGDERHVLHMSQDGAVTCSP